MNNPRRIQRHLVRAAAAGALLAAAALPLAIATSAGALNPPPTITSVSFTPHGATASTIAAGATGTVAITGTDFVNDGGTVTLSTNAADVTFSDIAETSSTTATADYTSTTAQAAGSYSLELTDNGNPGDTGVVADAFSVTATPTITSVSPSPIYEGTGANTVTVVGTGFETGATVSFVADSNGTPLTASVTSIAANGKSIVLSVTPTNPTNSAAAAVSTYTLTVSNPDGGSATNDTFAVTNGIQEVSPSAVAGTTQVSSDSVTLTGSGFEAGLTAVFSGSAACDANSATPADDTGEITNLTVGAVTGNSAILTFNETGLTTGECTIATTNPTVGGNGITYTSAAGALGIGESGEVAPIVTSSTAPTTAVAVGSTNTPVTLVGTGFSLYSELASTATGVTFSAPTGSTGTTITAPVSVAAGATAGAVPVTVSNDGAASTPLASGFTIAGPAITSASPAAIAQGTAYGTTVTLTGTGFTPTTTGTIAGVAGLDGVVSYSSATTMTLTITSSPTASGTGVITLTQSTAGGNVLTTFDLPVDAPPVVTGIAYPTGAPSDVGVGSAGTTVYINGSGFATGATVSKFTNASGTADANVTATVTKVTADQLTVTVAVTAPDTNTSVGYTVTNTDGGTAPVGATSTSAILLGAGPTITSITPATGVAGATTSFAVVGTGFETGAVVTLAPANGTCGTATVVSATSITVSCTLGQPSSVATDLVVTNPDGGSATGTTPVLAAAKPAAAPFKVGAVHGSAVAGKTVTLTISGSGFYGQPKITSTAAGSKIGVSKDTGKLLTVRVTTKKGVSGEHTFTIRLADGKSGKANDSIKK
jgi:hypothetical protein